MYTAPVGSQADAEGCYVYNFSAFLYTYAQCAYKMTKFLPTPLTNRKMALLYTHAI